MRVLATFRGGLASRSRELPRDFRGICVRRALMPTGQQPHNSRASPLYPQRDSNPCRHLERDSKRGRSELQRTERAGFRGFPDVANVDELGDSRRPRDLRGIGVDVTQSFGRGRCFAVSRCMATQDRPVRRRRVDSPARNAPASSGERGTLGAELDLHRRKIACLLITRERSGLPVRTRPAFLRTSPCDGGPWSKMPGVTLPGSRRRCRAEFRPTVGVGVGMMPRSPTKASSSWSSRECQGIAAPELSDSMSGAPGRRQAANVAVSGAGGGLLRVGLCTQRLRRPHQAAR